MGCCNSGGGSPTARGRRIVFVVFDSTGAEDSEHVIFEDARDRRDELGGASTIRNIKR